MRLFALLLAVLTLSCTHAQKCDIVGTCLGNELDFTVTDNAEECLKFCQSTQGCEWYTYDSSIDMCIAFEDCPETDSECTTCISGESICESLKCFVPGKCQGQLISAGEATSQEDCLIQCQEEEACNWFTFHMINHFCFLLKDCELDSSDGYSVSGEGNCTVPKIEYSKIVVQQGTNVNWISVPNANVLSEHQKCSTLPDYPENIQGAVDAVIDGQIAICGGNFTARCYVLNREINLWLEVESMSEPRAYAASTMTSQGWWVTGGKSSASTTSQLSSTELYNSTSNKWTTGPSLPSPRDIHCVVQINSALSFFTGGRSPTEQYTNDTWIYSWPEDLWTEMPLMPTPRHDMACDIFTDGEGVRHILVAGGDPDYITVESFSLDTDSWQSLPDLPIEANEAPAFVQNGNDLFLVNPKYNNVMLFDEESLEFEVINGQGTGVTGSHAAVIPINDENIHGC